MIDLNNNRISDKVKKIHLIAICGTGMGALGCMLKEMGFEITGSDQKVYPPMSDFLSEKGIEIVEGLMDGAAWSEKRDDFITRYAHRNDGGATKRVVKRIEKIVR